jgi:protein TonB
MTRFSASALAILIVAVTTPAARAQDLLGLARPATAVAAADPDARYVHQLRGKVGTALHYPASREARELRPAGTVKLWFDVDRSGRLLASGVESRSGTDLLDFAALRSLRTVQLPAFPGDAFAGEARHRFVMSVEYRAGSP